MTEDGLSQPVWHKSSYSSGGEGQCVEVALMWRKSSYSSGSEGQCVEVAGGGRRVLVRDSKDPAGPVLSFGVAEWAELARAIRRG